MKKSFLIACFSLGLMACTTTEQDVSTAATQTEDPLREALFHQWFAAEFDNYEQNWQDKIDAAKDDTVQVHEHIHHVFAPLATPLLDGETYYVKQYMDGDPSKVYRQRLYQFIRSNDKGAIQLNIYRFNDDKKFTDAHLSPELYQNLSQEEIKTYSGCEVYWKWNGEYFDGEMVENACAIKSSRSGKMLYFNDTLRLTDNEIWIADSATDEDGKHVFGNKKGIAHKNRKVTYFTGWGGARVGGKDAASDAKWHFTRKFVIHNEGQILPIVDDKTGEQSNYSIQLAMLTYQNTKDPILKLGLIDNTTDKTVTYIWSDRLNKKTGMNLRWMQAGLKIKEERPHFSF